MAQTTKDEQATENSQATRALTWAEQRDRMLVALGATAFVILGLWLLSHVARAMILLVIGMLLAYALLPVVGFLTRYMPRALALLITYLLLIGVIGGIGYLVVTSAIAQFTTLVPLVQHFVAAGPNGEPSQLVQTLLRLGFTKEQIASFEGQIVTRLQEAAQSIVPVVESVLSSTLDVVLVLMLSVYLIIDGERLTHWMVTETPLATRQRVVSFLRTLHNVVGGYIRGQLIMSTLIGTLVFVGMLVLHVPDAALLGVLAFILEFIPILGTLISGVVCVLLALTKGWILAVIVLAYFVVVHIIEGDVVGPRIVGKAVGIHPAVSIIALIAGGDLYGILGALFAAPVAGLAQALLADLYVEWRKSHPNQFRQVPADLP